MSSIRMFLSFFDKSFKLLLMKVIQEIFHPIIEEVASHEKSLTIIYPIILTKN